MKPIRIWQMGYLDKNDPTKSIIPTQKAVDKLKKMIESGTDDIIVGPEVKVYIVGEKEWN